MPNSTDKAPATDKTLGAHTANPASRSQLDEWRQKPESHEQLAVGQAAARSTAQTEAFLDSIEKGVESRRS
ncbi:hypothetical protein MMC28_004859 [Mycoblastus sanguinarius]|nr:hypothetical protein [Mycoblastus sanguinarius]